MDTAGQPDDFALPKNRYGFGVSWDALPGRPKVDLDLQCVVVSNSGAIIDCAYYNNLKAVRAITHSGDETTGAKSGIDEQVWVALPKLPPEAAMLVFVVAAYTGGQLRDAANGIFHVFEDSITQEIARFELEQSAASVDIVAVMFRGPAGWTLRVIEEPAQQGQHFMDILDLLAKVIRVFIPNAPARQKIAFAMEKGGILDLPQAMDSITIGLGWDTGQGKVDLDVSAVLLDAAGAEVETVFFGNLESAANGIKHSGDNLTGEGNGDDEQITAQLGAIGPRVQQVVFVVNIYTPGKTFRQVAHPYCRVIENVSGNELCRYSLTDAGSENGLIVSKIGREQGGRWGFHAVGLPCSGRCYKDSLRYIQSICNQDTRQLMTRGGTLDLQSRGSSVGHGHVCHPPPASAPPRPSHEASSGKACTVQ